MNRKKTLGSGGKEEGKEDTATEQRDGKNADRPGLAASGEEPGQGHVPRVRNGAG
ncbi:hypothetical protein T484DRAFT_1957510 [Baffinella frigidus]|nr:hypothetical protein T484DRAFT_1957510 [Cryptophyta sp. CCMP2293]